MSLIARSENCNAVGKPKSSRQQQKKEGWKIVQRKKGDGFQAAHQANAEVFYTT